MLQLRKKSLASTAQAVRDGDEAGGTTMRQTGGGRRANALIALIF